MYYKDNNSKKYKEYQKQKDNKISKKKWITSIKNLISKANYSKALSEIYRYLEKYPDDSFGLFQYAIVLKELGKKEESKELLIKIVDEGLESQYAALYKLGIMEALDGNQELAEEYFTKNINTSPHEEIYSYIELSRIKSSRGEFEEAKQILKQIKQTSNPRLITELARIYKLSGDFDKAYEIIKTYNFNGENTVNDNEAYITKANVEVALGLSKKAIEDYNNALETYKGNGYYKTLVELGSAYFEMNKYDKAYEICKDVINKNDSKIIGKAHLILGRIYQEINEYDLAKEHFEQSINYSYYIDDLGYFYIAMMEMNKKDYQEAKKYLEMVNPKNKYTKNSMVLLQLASIAYKEKKYKKARKIINQIDTKYVRKENINDYEVLNNYLYLKEGKEFELNTYSAKQIKEYSITRLVSHIDKVHKSVMEDSYFNPEINLNELVLQIPDLLEKAIIKENGICTIYQVNYPNIGFANEKETDILNIVMLPEDNQILTMYPSLPKIEKKIKVVEQKQKLKKKSQVDKFYAKYGNK